MLLVLLACLMPFYVLGGCYPNLTFNWEALRHEPCTYRGDFGDAVVDSIMRNHSGIGVKILKLGPSFIPYHNNLNSWLQVAVKPGIEELTLRLWPTFRKKYKFPVSLLSDGVRNSLRYLELGSCTFHPTSELGPLRSLTSLHLSDVRIRGDELQGFISNSLALETLELIECKGIGCLIIPCKL